MDVGNARSGGPRSRGLQPGRGRWEFRLPPALGAPWQRLRSPLAGLSPVAALLVLLPAFALGADLQQDAAAPATSKEPSLESWTGFYLGGHLGYAWGNSNWTASAGGSPISSGSLDFSRGIDLFFETGSWVEGLQLGYNYALPDNIVLGAEADATFPTYPSPTTGLTLGGASPLLKGSETYSENVFASGTLRGRIGYAPGNWLFYATGGLAWTDDQFALTQNGSGAQASAFKFRIGWAAGAGVETPIAPHWTGRGEYLFKDYGSVTVTFPSTGQHFRSDLDIEEFRIGVNYQFGDEAGSLKDAPKDSPKAGLLGDSVAFHAQTTLVEQGYPAFRSPYEGPNSLPGGGEGRETIDVTLFAGFKLWEGAELWVNPEIDQGFGIGDTHGVAGFTSAEAFKQGNAYPYARVQRFFIRQTIGLGGESENVEADQNAFEGSQTSNRVVLTAGRFYVTDLFDTNKYANNAKSDFLNWSVVNAGTFDYPADAWGNTYGAAAEWYQGRFTLRGGVFDLSRTPAGGESPLGIGLDPAFGQFSIVGEIEERHEIEGQPGKLKFTAFVNRGRAGLFADASALGYPADINAVRDYRNRPGVSVNLEQAVTNDIGVFARAGWADGNVEPWDYTDIDRTLEVGVSVSGKLWDRPDDRVGVAGAVNGISKIHEAFLNDGGLGILVGDGILPHPGNEMILETYYSYSLTSSTKLSFDYQFVDNPGYNTDRGPVSVFAGRVHWQY